MASVSVTINGKTYRMACDEGQEDHLISLAGMLDERVGQLKGSFGEIGDQRLTVMAGIMVADELCELQKRTSRMEAELADLHKRADGAEERVSSSEIETAKRISDAAGRIDSLAAKLSGRS